MPSLHNWTEEPCLGCKKLILTPDRQDFLCGDCREELYEKTAVQLAAAGAGAYDPTRMNEWHECWKVLRKMYCWPPTDEVGWETERRVFRCIEDNKYIRTDLLTFLQGPHGWYLAKESKGEPGRKR